MIVRNCSNYGEISAEEYEIGGIVGGAHGTDEGNNVTITNCINYGNIGIKNTKNSKNYAIGGIIGKSSTGEVNKSKNYGNIDGYEHIGGIVGYSGSMIIESQNEGNITVTYAGGGGIVGRNGGSTITKCSNKGKIYLTENGYFGIGGIAGTSGNSTYTSRIEQCFNEGEIYSLAKSSQGNSQAGGIVGNASSMSTQPVEVISCYNKGFVHGKGYVGGIAGYTRDGTLENCYNIGRLEILSGYPGTIGGIIGFRNSENNKIINNYYINNCGASFGLGTISSNEGAESKNESEMKNLVNILGKEYKEDTHYINNEYPILNWQ